jgi:hypothetical protein
VIFDHVIHVGAMRGEHTLDLVEGIFALRAKIVVVTDVAARTVLVLGPDAGEKDHPAGAFHGHRFGENALGPGAVGELLFSNAGGDGCCATAGAASAATIAAAINEACFGMRGLPSTGLATCQAYQAARIVRRPLRLSVAVMPRECGGFSTSS